VSGHAAADVLAAPGEADLSAHVDFAALAWSVKKSGARVHGPIAQGGFLRALGIDARATRLAAANPDRAAEIAASVHRLADAQRMGALFKVLAVAPRAARALPGFERC
jgi:NADH dehydrogenase [ubiquinone] 1 alpha subcomplex assembly factor 7